MKYPDQIRDVLDRPIFVIQLLILVSWPVSVAVNPHLGPELSPRYGLVFIALLTIWISMALTKRFMVWRLCGFAFMIVSALAFRIEIDAMGTAGMFWVLPVAVAICLGSSLLFAFSTEYLSSVACSLMILLIGHPQLGPTKADHPLVLVLWITVLLLGFTLNFMFIRAIRSTYAMKENYRRLAETDPLTGIANRRAFMRHVTQNLSSTPAGEIHFAMLDADDFKQVNDLHGHDVGDALLIAMAQELAQLGQDCKIGRLGGEEFGAWFEGRSTQQVSLSLQTMLERVAAMEVSGARFCFSAGVARRLPGDTVTTLVRRADHALYVAKRSGKRRIFFDISEELTSQASNSETGTEQ